MPDPTHLLFRRVAARVPAGLAPLPVQLRVAHLLGTVDLRPPGMPPAAILLIRRLRVDRPLPLGALRAGLAWESAARARVAALHRRAVRPLRGRVPPGAEAVLFQDEAEWLAILALEAATGTMPWWVAAIPGPATTTVRDADSAAPTAWQASPWAVPGAVAYLASWRRLSTVLAPWPVQAVRQVLSALSQTYDLHLALAALDCLLEGKPRRSARQIGLSGAPAVPAAGHMVPTAPEPLPRELDALPHELGWTALPLATRELAALALTLAVAPLLLRGTEAPALLARLVSATPAWRSRVGLTAASEPSPAVGSIVVRAALPWRLVPHRVAKPLVERATAMAPASPVLGGEADLQPAGVDSAPEHMAELQPWSEAGLATELGGLFLLLDIVLRAGLPDVFEAELGLPHLVTGWAFLELLGRALLGPDKIHDPAWAALAELDGRRCGETLPTLPVHDFHIPVAWLPDEPSLWRARATGGRLRVQHPDGDVILDRRVSESSVLSMLAEERARLGPRVPMRARRQMPRHAVLDSWTRTDSFAALPRGWQVLALGVLPCLMAQAGRRLGAEPVMVVPQLRTLIRRPARLHLAPTHLDIVFSLADLSLEARRAGLDADPGWVRDLMRVVRFHFA
jgi:hypothetical protein